MMHSQNVEISAPMLDPIPWCAAVTNHVGDITEGSQRTGGIDVSSSILAGI